MRAAIFTAQPSSAGVTIITAGWVTVRYLSSHLTAPADGPRLSSGVLAADSDGFQPNTGLVTDSAGNLYGTTKGGGINNGGTVFRLSPAGGGWSETFLYTFGSVSGDGTSPTGGLTIDTGGNLYGTTGSGGSNGLGTVFA